MLKCGIINYNVAQDLKIGLIHGDSEYTNNLEYTVLLYNNYSIQLAVYLAILEHTCDKNKSKD